jgi:glycerol uptake facilitator-like aquaporin
LGPALFTNGLGDVWIYVLGPALGAALAAWVYKLLK